MLGGLLDFEIDTAAISQPAGDRKLATVFLPQPSRRDYYSDRDENQQPKSVPQGRRS
jgi:hypothetical protein